ncbi:MAG: hypothetical protein RKH07_12640 [Gammaproteobacteria bacterium]
MNAVAILIHGYNVSDPRQTVGKIRPYLEDLGVLVENYTYGYWPLPIQVSRRNDQFAAEVAERCQYWKSKGFTVYLVGHSNGCVIARTACLTYGAPVDRILAIHPALKRHLSICGLAERIIVVHNQGDLAVVAGGLLGRLTALFMPKWESARPWGEMGQDGYQGPSSNHINIDSASRDYSVKCWGHSDEFSEKKKQYWLTILTKALTE